MRWQPVDLLLAVAFLLCLSATLVSAHRDHLAFDAQQQRQAALTACQAQVLAAIQATGAFRDVDPARKLMGQALQLETETTRLLHEQLAINHEWRRMPRAGQPSFEPAAQRAMEAKAKDHQLLVTAALQRETAATAPLDAAMKVSIAEMNRLNGNSSRLLARQSKLSAAVAAGYRPPSRVRPWATVLTVVLPLAWSARLVWARRRRLDRITNSRCVVCNYDLRATPDRCPECGTITEIKSPTASTGDGG